MSRPTVSVVMPFAGDRPAADAALDTLGALATHTGDELILADNAGTAPPREGVAVIRAVGERSPAHARNVGAEHASGEWILFLDADCRAPVELLDTYFAEPPDDKVGALAGEVVSAAPAPTLASRYGAARGFLSQRAHLAHPYLPRAVAANLMVRREAFEAIGGFYEGVRAAEDTDFSWRLQRAGWQLELRPGASVEHRYRATVRELRRQWRGYAAGRAWLRRRYAGFVPEPALRRAARRALRIVLRRGPAPATAAGRGAARDRRASNVAGTSPSTRCSRSTSWRASRSPTARRHRARAAFPPAWSSSPIGSPSAATRSSTSPARSRASGSRRSRVPTRRGSRPRGRSRSPTARMTVSRPACSRSWRSSSATRSASLRDLRGRRPGQPPLVALAPAVRRLRRSPGARVQPVGGADVQAAARRLAALAGLAIDSRGRR